MPIYVPLTDVPAPSDQERIRALAGDFENLLGPNNIVVRTSGEQGQPKGTNLLRSSPGAFFVQRVDHESGES
jgi:hypothetical protein